ncbi:MAG: serine protease [Polyangiales bacterium]
MPYQQLNNPSSPPDVPIYPYVRLRYAKAGGTRLGIGSAFFLRNWGATLITAAHVLRGLQEQRATRLRVDAFDASNRSYLFFAKSILVPSPGAPVDDIALISLSSEAMIQDPWDLGILPPPPFAARLFGYPADQGVTNAAVACATLDVTVDQTDPALLFRTAVGKEGMSGGPVVNEDGGVVGCYVGDVPVAGAIYDGARSIDYDLLNSLHDSLVARDAR